MRIVIVFDFLHSGKLEVILLPKRIITFACRKTEKNKYTGINRKNQSFHCDDDKRRNEV
jgi:hypothetical protein